MSKRDAILWVLPPMLLLATACGDQASPGFQGESMLTFGGRVELLDATADGPLVPALAFQGPNGRYFLLDAEVRGEFPSAFSATVSEPPPPPAMLTLSSLQPGEPDVAVAFIVVVPLDHAPEFQHSNAQAFTTDCMGISPCRRVRREFCYTESREGEPVPGIAECYVEVRQCDFEIDFELEQDHASCELLQFEGDPRLGQDVGSRFHGFSQDHEVMYLASAAPAGSLVARAMGAPAGVAEGYHLVRLRERSVAERAEAERCDREAEELGWQRFVADHPDTPCRRIDGVTSCEDFEAGRLIPSYVLGAQSELACPAPGDRERSIVDADADNLTLRMGHELGNLAFGSDAASE